MKRFLTLIIALIVCSAANAQVLYKITGNGLKESSYIIGTCHLVTNTFVDSIPGANRVLDEVSQICGEIETKDLQNLDTLQAIMKIMNLPGDSTIRDLMTEEKFNKLCQVTKESLGIDLTQPQFNTILKLRPLFFSMTTAAMSEQLKAIQSGKPAQKAVLMDIHFQEQAALKGKPCIGLETSSFQMRMLTRAMDDNFDVAEQIDNIIEGFQKLDSAKAEVLSLIDAYKSLDINQLEEYMDKAMKDSKDIENIVLSTRNENWSKQIPTIIAEKSTLFAVGCGHLVGEKSVLKLLKAQGFTIEAVKE